MNNPLVSVVIPLYNAELYISDAIESVLSQSYNNIELIVVDDGSTDLSPKITKSYSDLTYVRQNNKGGNAARNLGLKLAKADYILFLDADDVLYEKKIESLVARSLASDSNELIFSDWSRCDVNLNVVYEKSARVPSSDHDSIIYNFEGGLNTPAPLHKRALLDTVGGFKEGMPCAQERDLHIRLACLGVRFTFLPSVLHAVRMVENSVSSNYLEVINQHERMGLTALDTLAKSNLLNDERRRAIAGFFAVDARELLKLGCPEQSKKYFVIAKTVHADGGISYAYGKASKFLYNLFGARLTETIVSMGRKVASRDKSKHQNSNDVR